MEYILRIQNILLTVTDKSKLIQMLEEELTNIKTALKEQQISQEECEDLTNARALCEINLRELKGKDESLPFSEDKEDKSLEISSQQTISTSEISSNEKKSLEKNALEYTINDDMNGFSIPVYSTPQNKKSKFKIIDDMEQFPEEENQIEKVKEIEATNEFQTPFSQESFSNPPDYDIFDDIEKRIIKTIHLTPQNSRKSENSDFEIIDDIKEALKSEEDTQEKESISKNINIYISEKNGFVQYTDKEGKKLELSISSIKEEKPNTYKRIPIHKICKKIAGNRIQGAYLSHKINPILIKILDSTGNNQMIYDYIESIHNHQPLPVNLYHDLSGLTEIEKWKLQRYTKSEEKCRAEIIKDSEMKLLFEQKSKKTKRNTDFIQKVDGNQEEIARNYNEQKRPIEDLLNALDASPSCKMAIADYISKFGEEKARIRYKKQFAQAEAKLSIQGFIDNQSTR